MSLSTIPYIIPILSGKGGVGKSSVTVQLALALTLHGHSVGVLDVDLTGPSIPRLFGIEGSKVRQAPGGWLPVEVYKRQKPDLGHGRNTPFSDKHVGSLHCMSLGFLLKNRGDAVVWRGPKKTAMVKQLLSDVLWPQGMEYLLIDTPPGTSDEHISLITNLLDPSKVHPSQQLGAVIVTTPQAIATSDVKKELTFCRKTSLQVLGVVENMAGFVCPCCGEVTNVFSKGGGEVMAKEWGVSFLGSVPLDGDGWGMLIEEGKRPVYEKPQTTWDEGKGQKESEVLRTRARERQQERGDATATLADKYTSCSLYPIFSKFVDQIVKFDRKLPQKLGET